MNSFRIHILAAEHSFYEGEGESLIVPAPDGQYGVQAGHSPVLAAIVPGTLWLRTPEREELVAAVSEGLLRVENNDVLVLVDTIERPEEIDANRARRDAEEAREALLQKQSRMEYRMNQARMSRALSRLKVKGGR